MWNRLVKKLVDANGDGDNDNAGKGTSTTTSSKKRKTAGTPQVDSSTAKGNISPHA